MPSRRRIEVSLIAMILSVATAVSAFAQTTAPVTGRKTLAQIPSPLSLEVVPCFDCRFPIRHRISGWAEEPT
jgi:hypothetical protein